jgi:hypothetical protein
LKQQHAQYKSIMAPMLVKPFPSPPKIPYLSFRTGTIINIAKKKFPIPRCYSVLDFRAFELDKTTIDVTESIESDWNLSDVIHKQEDAQINTLHKSNSEHALYTLGKKARLRRDLELDPDNAEIDRVKTSLGKFRQKSKWRSMDESSGDDKESSDDDDVSEDAVELFDENVLSETKFLVYQWIQARRFKRCHSKVFCKQSRES